MLNRILRKLRLAKPARVYLGSVAIVPASSFSREINFLLGELSETELNAELEEHLSSWLDIPSAPEPESAEKNDLSLDVFVNSYQTGTELFGNIGEIPIIYFRRPKVELRSRLSRIKDKAIITTFSVKKRMKWRRFLPRVLSMGILPPYNRAASSQEMEYLLAEALIDVMETVRKRV